MPWWLASHASAPCPFCLLAQGSPAGGTSSLLYQDERIVAFQDINPSAYRHYLVVPKEHIPTIADLRKGDEHQALVEHMVKTGEMLLQQDAPNAAEYKFGFHRPPFNSVHHLHLHCLALPFRPRWKAIKYSSFGGWGGYIDAQNVLKRIDPRWTS